MYTPGNFRADGNISSNIFYDQGNTDYYVQPSKVSNVQYVAGDKFEGRDLGQGNVFVGTQDTDGNGLLPGFTTSGRYPVLGSTGPDLYVSVGGAYAAYFSTGGINNVSDERMKTDIRDLGPGDFHDALASLDKIRSVRFRYKQEVSAVKSRFGDPSEVPLHIGVIAQSLPESVVSEDRQLGILGMNQADMIGFLVASLRGVRGEAQAKIAAQQAKINELEERLAALEAALTKR